MADATEIAEIAADGVADGMHIVSEEALAAEKAVRGMERAGIAYFGLGLAAGAAAGALIAFRIAYKKAETKYSEIAAEEVAEMRQHYQDKLVALDANNKKKDVEEIVRERGYSVEPEQTEPPMAVTPPTTVVDAAREAVDDEDVVEVDDDPGDPMEEVLIEAHTSGEEPKVRNVFAEHAVDDTWDSFAERKRRSPLEPYVIHRDERDEFGHYDDVTWTYYEADDVLCNERDEVVAGDERDKLLGEANLEKFGHGSGDAQIVYIRNDQLEMQFEIVRSPNSYAEEVHGFDPPEPEIRHAHRGRTSFDDD